MEFLESLFGWNSYGKTQDYILKLPPEVISHILSFLPPEELILNCQLVSKSFHDLINQQTFWSCIYDSYYGIGSFRKISQVCVDSVAIVKVILFYNLFKRNLIKNPSGSDKTMFWKVIQNGGNGIVTEGPFDSPTPGVGINNREFHEAPMWLEPLGKFCFATSYHDGILSQTICLNSYNIQDIFDKAKPQIHVGVWYAGRVDCGVKGTVRFTLLGQKGDSLDEFVQTLEIPQWQGGEWIPLVHTFTSYPNGLRKIQIYISGKDTQFWAGHYGMKFCGATVMIAPP